MKRKLPALRNIGIDLNQRALEEFQCNYPVELVHGNAHRFLADFPYRGRELVYCDPPYLHSLRTSDRRYRYEYEYEESDHIELLRLLKSLPCQIILSGYPSQLYDQELPGWRSLELQVMNQAGVRTEKVWFNFSPNRVHWARYAGKNHTDRQRIKRKAESWAERYSAMPPGERMAVLAALMAIEAGETAMPRVSPASARRRMAPRDNEHVGWSPDMGQTTGRGKNDHTNSPNQTSMDFLDPPLCKD